MTKKCNHCGAMHGAVAWSQLPLVGYQDDGEGGWLELRNCPCTSTLGVQAAARPARPVAPPECTKVAASN